MSQCFRDLPPLGAIRFHNRFMPLYGCSVCITLRRGTEEIVEQPPAFLSPDCEIDRIEWVDSKGRWDTRSSLRRSNALDLSPMFNR